MFENQAEKIIYIRRTDLERLHDHISSTTKWLSIQTVKV